LTFKGFEGKCLGFSGQVAKIGGGRGFFDMGRRAQITRAHKVAVKSTTQNNAPCVNFEPGFATTVADPLKKHKLHKICQNIRYFNKEGTEISLDIFIVSFAE
jgi:hypothetical protein